MTMIECNMFFTLDSDDIGEFLACYQELMEDVETICNNLNGQLDRQSREEQINDLFRAMHSLKGNCRMVFLDAFVGVFHRLEELISDIREDKYPYHSSIGEYINTSVWQLQNLLTQLVRDGELAVSLLDGIENDIRDFIKQTQVNGHEKSTVQQAVCQKKLNADLTFFHGLALKLDARRLVHRGSIRNFLSLCLDMNRCLPHAVNETQLQAAVYIHDLGLAHLPKQLLSKPVEAMNQEEQNTYFGHINIGLALLTRNDYWHEAAQIVQQHHEYFDGSGFPQHLKGKDIHLGAMLISLANDYSLTLYAQKEIDNDAIKRTTGMINIKRNALYNPEVLDALNEVTSQYLVSDPIF